METTVKRQTKTVLNELRHTRVSRVTLFGFLLHILFQVETFNIRLSSHSMCTD